MVARSLERDIKHPLSMPQQHVRASRRVGHATAVVGVLGQAHFHTPRVLSRRIAETLITRMNATHAFATWILCVDAKSGYTTCQQLASCACSKCRGPSWPHATQRWRGCHRAGVRIEFIRHPILEFIRAQKYLICSCSPGHGMMTFWRSWIAATTQSRPRRTKIYLALWRPLSR